MATARTAYRRFVAKGIHQPSPWKDLRGQIFLGGSEFRERIARLVQGTPLTNVPALQNHLTRLSPDEVLQHVVAILNRSHRDAYQTTVYLLRRAALSNLPFPHLEHSEGRSNEHHGPRSNLNSSQHATSRTDPILF
ncbi:MAG: hypothetical protein AABY61_02610 [Nitrospirota bacterium]